MSLTVRSGGQQPAVTSLACVCSPSWRLATPSRAQRGVIHGQRDVWNLSNIHPQHDLARVRRVCLECYAVLSLARYCRPTQTGDSAVVAPVVPSRELDLDSNAITGTIPNAISALTGLSYVAFVLFRRGAVGAGGRVSGTRTL